MFLMKIYHMEFAKTGGGMSGGETCLLEQVRYFKSKHIKNILLTTDNGEKTYKKVGLAEDDYLEYKTIRSEWSEKKHHIFISYVIRTLDAIKLVKNIDLQDDDILFCHSDFFPNSIPFYFLATKNKNTKLYYWFHMLAPNIFRGYEGQFTNKLQMPKLNVVHYNMNQWLYRMLTFNRGVIITVNSYYEKILSKKYYKNKIYAIQKFGGADVTITGNEQKIYDIAWLGRFHSSKGIFEIPEILSLLRKKNKNIRIVIMGDGVEKTKAMFKNKIKKEFLDNSVEYRGFVFGNEKFSCLKQSRIFLMTSCYESFGLVNLEAMKCGLPVVAYNLPVFEVFNKGMIKVDILDNKKLADEALRLINDREYYEKISSDALRFSGDFSWEKTGEEIYKLMFD